MNWIRENAPIKMKAGGARTIRMGRGVAMVGARGRKSNGEFVSNVTSMERNKVLVWWRYS